MAIKTNRHSSTWNRFVHRTDVENLIQLKWIKRTKIHKFEIMELPLIIMYLKVTNYIIKQYKEQFFFFFFFFVVVFFCCCCFFLCVCFVCLFFCFLCFIYLFFFFFCFVFFFVVVVVVCWFFCLFFFFFFFCCCCFVVVVVVFSIKMHFNHYMSYFPFMIYSWTGCSI